MTIAFWCVFVAAFLPYIALGFAGRRNSHAPRAGDAALTGRAARAVAAQLNAFEAFPAFAAGVVISHIALGPNSWSNILAAAFILVRLAHMGSYIADLQPHRSIAWFVGILIVIALFLHAAFA